MDLGITYEESEISMTFDTYDNVYITGYTRNRFESKKSSGDFTEKESTSTTRNSSRKSKMRIRYAGTSSPS